MTATAKLAYLDQAQTCIHLAEMGKDEYPPDMGQEAREIGRCLQLANENICRAWTLIERIWVYDLWRQSEREER